MDISTDTFYFASLSMRIIGVVSSMPLIFLRRFAVTRMSLVGHFFWFFCDAFQRYLSLFLKIKPQYASVWLRYSQWESSWPTNIIKFASWRSEIVSRRSAIRSDTVVTVCYSDCTVTVVTIVWVAESGTEINIKTLLQRQQELLVLLESCLSICFKSSESAND